MEMKREREKTDGVEVLVGAEEVLEQSFDPPLVFLRDGGVPAVLLLNKRGVGQSGGEGKQGWEGRTMRLNSTDTQFPTPRGVKPDGKVRLAVEGERDQNDSVRFKFRIVRM
jgi:hypothetical protein